MALKFFQSAASHFQASHMSTQSGLCPYTEAASCTDAYFVLGVSFRTFDWFNKIIY
jgi:hypothetical protein